MSIALYPWIEVEDISSTPVIVLISFSSGRVISFSMFTGLLPGYGVPMKISGITTSGKLSLGTEI